MDLGVEATGSQDGTASCTNAGEDQGEREQEGVDSIEDEIRAQGDISCHIGPTGLVTALTQRHPPSSSAQPDSLYIEHLRIRAGKSDGVWFASTASAYGTSSQTILWNYTIPDAILSFSRHETVPCGVVVLLGLVDESETPEWATRHRDDGAALDRFVQRCREQHRAKEAEARMDPAQREQAFRDRMRLESEQRIQDCQLQEHLFPYSLPFPGNM